MICAWCGELIEAEKKEKITATGENVHERCCEWCLSCGVVALPDTMHLQDETGDRICDRCDPPKPPEKDVNDTLWRRRQERLEPREWYETGGYSDGE